MSLYKHVIWPNRPIATESTTAADGCVFSDVVRSLIMCDIKGMTDGNDRQPSATVYATAAQRRDTYT